MFLTGFVRFILTRMSPFRSRPGSMVMQMLVWPSPWTLLQISVTHTHVNHKQPHIKNTNMSLNIRVNNAWHISICIELKGSSLLSCSLRAWRKLQGPSSVMCGKSTCGLLRVCVRFRSPQPPNTEGRPWLDVLKAGLHAREAWAIPCRKTWGVSY